MWSMASWSWKASPSRRGCCRRRSDRRPAGAQKGKWRQDCRHFRPVMPPFPGGGGQGSAGAALANGELFGADFLDAGHLAVVATGAYDGVARAQPVLGALGDDLQGVGRGQRAAVAAEGQQVMGVSI